MELHSSNATELFVILSFGLWTTAWLFHNLLAQAVWRSLGGSNNYNLVYWALLKVLVWIAFPVFYAKKVMKVEDLKTFLAIRNARMGIVWGLVAGSIWIAASYVFQGDFKFHTVLSFTLLWLLTGILLAEEFTFRGIILPGLQKGGL